MKFHIVGSFTFGIVFTLLQAFAHASPLVESVGAAGSVNPWTRSIAYGAEAAYTNPALLNRLQGGFLVGWATTSTLFSIELADRPESADISIDIYEARRLNADGTTGRLEHRPMPTSALPKRREHVSPRETYNYTVIGGVFHFWDQRIALGMYGLVPMSSFQNQHPFYVDEREQFFSNSLHFERYGDRLLTNSFSFALGIEPIAGLSIGLGATLANDATSTNPIYLPDPSEQENSFVNARVDITTRVVPHFALAWQDSAEQWSMTATLHLPYYNEVQGQSQLRFWNYDYADGEDSVLQEFRYIYDYEPLRASLGAQWHIIDRSRFDLEVAISALWAQWSAYYDRHSNNPTKAWSDTISTAVHTRLSWPTYTLFVNAKHAPSPVPDQIGRTNYVDNSRLALALGTTRDIVLDDFRFQIGLQLQTQRLLLRHTTKNASSSDPVIDEFPDSVYARTNEPIESSHGIQSNNPGFPGYSSQGWLFHSSVFLQTSF